MILKVFSYLNDSMINDFVSPHNNQCKAVGLSQEWEKRKENCEGERELFTHKEILGNIKLIHWD